MKHITLVRHAKSSWSDPTLNDIDRPLKKRGIVDAENMATYILNQNIVPDLFVSSPAKRAYQTAQIFAQKIIKDIEAIEVDDRLYLEGEDVMLKVIREQQNQYQSMILFSHMPYIASLFSELTGNFVYEYPTCGLAHMQFDIDKWEDVLSGEGKSKLFLYPKMMPWHLNK